MADVDTGFAVSVTQQGSSDQVTGWGDSKRFTNVSTDAGILRLHPSGAADTDVSRDIAFWRAYPLMESITASGENPKTVSVTFRIYPDPARANAINKFAFGVIAG